ncbi:MAG: GGDEF domain-containing protein [Xanthomonadales bacterium]|nr:GGDEF domain-containing protein [Xanthomonadales bacterium]
MSIGLENGLGLLFFLAFGLIYAAWFKRFRAAYGFIWLIFLVAGLAAREVAKAAGWPLSHDLGATALAWLPWNLLLLSWLPMARLPSLVTAAVVFLLTLELVLPLWFEPGVWDGAAGINTLLQRWVPERFASWIIPVEPLVTVLASISFFLRWQMSDRSTELAMSLMATVLLVGVMRPSMLTVVVAGAAGVLFLGVIYTTHRMAFVDALTGLPNRRSLDLTLSSMPRQFAIAMLDIDHFKRINDRFGHDFGDQVLRMVASRVRRVGRFKAFRYGGEEFCLLFLGAERTRNAADVCEEVRAAVEVPPMAFRAPIRPDHKPLKKDRYREKVPSLNVTVSIGLADNSSGQPPDAVIEAADKALYSAKRGGRNKVVVSKK